MLADLVAAIPLLAKLVDYLTGRQRAKASADDRKAGGDAVSAQTERSSLDAINRAQDAALVQSQHDLTGLRDDDGFKRTDRSDGTGGAKPAAKT